MVRENAWYDFNFLDFVEACFASYLVVFANVHMHLKRKCILLLWVEMFCIYQLSSFYLGCHSVPRYPCWFFIWKINSYPLLTMGRCPSISVLLSISFLKSKIFFIYLGASMLGAYVYNVYVFLMDSSLEYYEMTFWVSFWPSFWSLFYLIWVLLPKHFFFCSFAWNISFQPFTFSLCRSSVLRWVSCRQHMCGSCFLIHSATLCLFIGTFNPFTFKVSIDRYLFIVIFPLFRGKCSSVSHSFSSSS